MQHLFHILMQKILKYFNLYNKYFFYRLYIFFRFAYIHKFESYVETNYTAEAWNRYQR